MEHEGRQQSQNRDAQPGVPEDVDAVHCGPEDDPDDDPPELLDPPDPLDDVLEPLELLEPLEPLDALKPLDPPKPLDPDELPELLGEPLELADEPLGALNPLFEPPPPLLLPAPLLDCPELGCPELGCPELGCPESEGPPSEAPERPPEPASALGATSSLEPPSSPGLPAPDVSQAEPKPTLSPRRQRPRNIRGMPVAEVG